MCFAVKDQGDHIWPIFECLLWAAFWEITGVVHIFSGYYFPRLRLCMFSFRQNELGFILGNFFTKSSGHPAKDDPRLANAAEVKVGK
jgi:hypothetical protein